jgi:hypothetical protein
MVSLYHELAIAIRTSERPEGLNREEQAQYERLLDEQAAAFERKADEIYENHRRGASAGSTERRTAPAFERLGELRARPAATKGHLNPAPPSAR